MPHFGLNQPITFERLQSLSCLALGAERRPVFLLTAKDNSAVVIKNETQVYGADAANLKLALKTMKQVSAAADGKPLAPEEVRVLREYLELEEEVAELSFRPLSPCLAYFKQIFDAGNMWFKMAKATGLLDLKEARAQADAGDKTGIRAIADALTAPNGLEGLGQIIAADLWSGNNDRFAPFGATAAGMQVLQNAGNVITAIQGGLRKPIGLDAYEAMGTFRNWAADPTDYESPDDQWGGRLLSGTAQANHALRQFCIAAIQDIEAVLGPRNRRGLGKLGTSRRLPRNAPQRLEAGIRSGAQAIRAKMGRMAAKPNAPAGLAPRMQLANW